MSLIFFFSFSLEFNALQLHVLCTSCATYKCAHTLIEWLTNRLHKNPIPLLLVTNLNNIICDQYSQMIRTNHQSIGHLDWPKLQFFFLSLIISSTSWYASLRKKKSINDWGNDHEHIRLHFLFFFYQCLRVSVRDLEWSICDLTKYFVE